MLGRMDIMTTVKSKLLVDSQNSFLVYHFKSLKLVQNICYEWSVHYNSWTLDKQKVSEYKQENPHLLLQINPRHREEEQQNTYS